MRLTRVVFALAIVAPVLPAQSSVIPAWPVASGSRVRVLSPALGDKQQVGVVVSATRDTLSFRSGNQPAYTSISTSDIRQLDISQGTHTRRLNGGLIGFLVGAAGGAAIGAATHKDPPPCTDFINCGLGILSLNTSRSGDAILGATLGGVLGAIVGTLVGARAVDTWVPVAVPVT